jgi:DNA-directed RNA polymerase specialized sigma24 family protein
VLDLDAKSAADVLGISPTNCTTRLNRALKKLEEALDVAA